MMDMAPNIDILEHTVSLMPLELTKAKTSCGLTPFVDGLWAPNWIMWELTWLDG